MRVKGMDIDEYKVMLILAAYLRQHELISEKIMEIVAEYLKKKRQEEIIIKEKKI